MKRALIRVALAAILAAAASAASAQTLTSIKQRGVLNCGSNGTLAGFGSPDAQGRWTGLDVDFCRALSAAIFNDSNKIKFVPLTARDRFTALQSGDVDVLARNTTWTSSRDTSLGLNFTGINYFDGQGFTLVDTPIFTPAACEGTTTLFEVNYFDEEKLYLTQSGQLYNEANAMALGRVYCFGPTFRAEKSKTRRHLTEFWMVEPEMAYADLNDVIELAEGLITSVVARVLDTRKTELAILERDTSKLESITAPFPRLRSMHACLPPRWCMPTPCGPRASAGTVAACGA